ncbi:CamS family sex pheromone protein [Companilactobacillus sp. RD055328]|uniref:CamS family sex pheromone protein n=1 Tax=Companilactobacillus sp. RD055328 TaxID=2916634 RepID=UPI001FC8AA10|nr:CamS family sex pheromone protein [Companilactobacillus sp. RD055328]GKQ43130.1 CamS family sex pheromone protein [Companilactobacillus sp. RD055328]
MKKKFLGTVILGLLTVIIAGCGNLQNSSLSTGGTDDSKKGKTVQTTNSSDGSSYNTLLQGKQYQTSAISGLSSGSNNNQFNLQSFESGLLDISNITFPTKDYTLQEGQILKAADVQKWLQRKSKDNPDGLNPEDNGNTDPKKRNPLYLSQILENDFYKESGNGYSLAGISIGLSMNQIDYYTKVQYGATFSTKISDADRIEQGKKMANEIVSRLRGYKKSKDLPITVALYSAEPVDSLVGGNYFMYGVSKNGNKSIGDWKDVSNNSQVLPLVGNSKAINSADLDSFTSFKSHIQNYFPKLSGVVGKVHYKDGNLKQMSITINTQFFGVSEVRSFTQYVEDAASTYLPSGVPIEIKIESVNGMQSFVARDLGQKNFYSHVFNDY